MGGRDHSCDVCGRGGLNDPDGVCECPDTPPMSAEVAKSCSNCGSPHLMLLIVNGSAKLYGCLKCGRRLFDG